MNLDTLLVTAITTDASRRGPRGSLQELTGRLGGHRTPDANDIGEWIRRYSLSAIRSLLFVP